MPDLGLGCSPVQPELGALRSPTTVYVPEQHSTQVPGLQKEASILFSVVRKPMNNKLFTCWCGGAGLGGRCWAGNYDLRLGMYAARTPAGAVSDRAEPG